MTESRVYLYAIARGLEPARLEALTGVSGTPVRTVRQAGLVAVVSTVPLSEYGERALCRNLEKPEWLERAAREHHAVVEVVARHVPAAPIWPATVFRDDRRVANLLDERRAQFGTTLSSVTGRSEWGVKVYVQSGAYSAEHDSVPEAGPFDRGQRPGTAYLRRRRPQRQGGEDSIQRMAATAEKINGELMSHASAHRRHRPRGPRLSPHDGVMILNVAYLVDDGNGVAFVAAAERLEARLRGTRVEVTGPWPAYSFISLEDDSVEDES
jgi:hypothetical protein